MRSQEGLVCSSSSCWCVWLRWGSFARVCGCGSSAIWFPQYLLRRRLVLLCALLLNWFNLLRRRHGVVSEVSGGSAASPCRWRVNAWSLPVASQRIPRFVPTTASSFSLAAPDTRSWLALDCRHGRALFLSKGQGTRELLLWEPTMGFQQRIPVPTAFERDYSTAAVFCSADGCDHRDCQGGPFRVVFVFTGPVVGGLFQCSIVTSACVYWSETGTWSGLTSCDRFDMTFTNHSSVLIGRSLLYFMSNGGTVLEYDLSRHILTGFDTPYYSREYIFNLMLTEDGGLGVCGAFSTHLKLWSREASDETDARWVPTRLIYLRYLLPTGALVDAETRVLVLGFAEGANVIFVNTAAGLFSIELQSNRVRKMCDDHGFCNLIPVVSFYTPVSQCEHKDLLLLNPIEDAGDEDGGRGEEKTVDMAHQLFDNGSNDIKEGDFVSTLECVSDALENS